MSPRRTALLALLLLAACGGAEPAPIVPGELTLRLSAPGTAPGAVLVAIAGGPVAGVAPAAGIESALGVEGGETRLLLIGPLGGGDVAVLTIPDVSLASRYGVRIEQVADATTFALLDPVQWSASLVPR